MKSKFIIAMSITTLAVMIGTASAATYHRPVHHSSVQATPVTGQATTQATQVRVYPLHTSIVSTTFWVGEIFDPNAADGSQVYSTYDSHWELHYGGCDGVAKPSCQTEARTAASGYYPNHMIPKENPFYLDLPFDDVNNSAAFKARCSVVPWANDPGYAGHCKDSNFSYMKNQWVQITGPNGHTCYGQIEDAGPGKYNDSKYVFGSSDARPASRRYGHAGMDVSPALNGCLGFAELDGDSDHVSWRFIAYGDVPAGPWTKLVTTSGLDES